MPVRKRRAYMGTGPWTSTLAALAAAPRRLEYMKRRREDTRSGRLRRADTSAPRANPAWTLMVIHERWPASRPHSRVSCGSTAEPENQSPMARTMARAKNPRCRHFPAIMRTCGLLDDRRLHDVIELRKSRDQIGIAFILNPHLLGARRVRPILSFALPITRVERVDDVHSLHHFAQRAESDGVETAVVGVVDEELRGARIWESSLGERHAPPRVAFLHRLVGDGRFTPDFVHLGIAVDPEL